MSKHRMTFVTAFAARLAVYCSIMLVRTRLETGPSGAVSGVRPRTVSTNDVSKIKVVIIDSHEAVRRALRIRLGVTDHLEVVGTFADPQAAEKQLQGETPDVIVMGLHSTSDEELFSTALAVRDLTHGSAVVIVLAPYADVMERELLLGAGAKRYLLKHINSNYLIHEIEAVAPHWANSH